MSKEINPQIRAIADELKPLIKPDATTGVAADDGAEDIFTKFLPQNISLDIVKEVQGALLDFTAAQTLAHGEVQIAHLKKHPELKSGSLVTKVGYSSIESTLKRETSGTMQGKEWKKQGVAVTDFVLGTGRKRSDYNSTVTYLGDHAASVFGN